MPYLSLMNAATKTVTAYQFTNPTTGETVTFNSKNTVTHVVCVVAMNFSSGRREERPGYVSTHGSLKGATKGAETARSRGWDGVTIVEVTPV